MFIITKKEKGVFMVDVGLESAAKTVERYGQRAANEEALKRKKEKDRQIRTKSKKKKKR
ncbi:MAG: hypothetical protein U9M94_02330 [Patescibacteria group bacterium]|nr:hypothetical protein [Patescibacteria group bacterium]